MGWLDYINASPDLAAAYKASGSTDPNAWGSQHYNTYGKNENRPGVPTTFQTPAPAVASSTPQVNIYGNAPNPVTGRLQKYKRWADPNGTLYYVANEFNLDEAPPTPAGIASMLKNGYAFLVNPPSSSTPTTPAAVTPPAAVVPSLPNTPNVGGTVPNVTTPTVDLGLGLPATPTSASPPVNTTEGTPIEGTGVGAGIPVTANQGLLDKINQLSEQVGGLFNLPTLTKDVYPKTSSGIDWNTGYGADLLKSLTNSINQLPEMAQNFGNTLQDQYTNLMKRSLSPNMFQGTLNNLANRGMLGSSVASEAMSDTAKDIMNTVGDRAYESQLQGLQQQMQLPGLLGQLAQLLNRSESANPLAPYELAMNYY